jgi:hypothetical protein
VPSRMICQIKADVRNENNWMQGPQRACGNCSKALLRGGEGLAPYLMPIYLNIVRLANPGEVQYVRNPHQSV